MKKFLLLVLSVYLYGADNEKNLFRLDSNAGFSFYAEKDNIDSRNFIKILDLCAKNISASIGKKNNDSITRFFLYETVLNKDSTHSHIYLNQQQVKKLDDISLIFLINKGLLRAHFDSDTVPNWINASIVYNALHTKNDFTHLQKRYFFTRYNNLNEGDFKLDFIKHLDLLKNAPYLIKSVYLEKSKILSRIVFKNKKLKHDVFSKINKNTYDNAYLLNALHILAKQKNITFELWLQEQINKMIFNHLYPIHSGLILSKLDKLSNLTISRKNKLGQFELVQLPLEDLATYKNSTINTQYLTTIINNFSKTINKSPFYTRPYLLDIQKVLIDFSRGKKSGYKKKILHLKKQIQESRELEMKRHQWFKSIVKEKYKSPLIYPEILNSYDELKRRNEKFFPEAYNWFNKLENQINNIL
ncbi:hypothetical protein PQO03_03290 [Lentisphaera profundi]|uniref:Uncharacterized protein n=1 Tax=Lentisphaera profundi TaxID=1658616 RepID=A0ABY7VW71_9BACT|nr:hypothetical protein [Lentisphaera profundi]WDE96984.1 hypothetical protein PQO03_03290 [Lentisphaera profundi]